MADFVAVIRRAVDGLSDNTPDMRGKVYEKARSAVVRQLESMKPRPPEEMLRRQLDKLEAAILEVENEHAEALPAANDPEKSAAEDSYARPAEPDGADAGDRDTGLPTLAVPASDEEPGYDTASREQPVPEVSTEARWHETPARERWQPDHDDEVSPDFPIEEPTSHYGRSSSQGLADTVSDSDPGWIAEGLGTTATGTELVESWSPTAVHQPEPDVAIAETTPDLLVAYEEAKAQDGDLIEPLGWRQAVATSPLEVDAEPAEFVEAGTVHGELGAAEQDIRDEAMLHGEPVYPVSAEAAAAIEPNVSRYLDNVEMDASGRPRSLDYYQATEMPVSDAQRPDADLTNDAWDGSPLSDVPRPNAEPVPGDGRRADDRQWEAFQDFSASDASAMPKQAREGSEFASAAADKPARSYRIQPPRKVDFTSIGLGLLGLALVAGSGYGAWTFRDTLSGLVTGLVSAPPSEAPKSPDEPTPSKTADPAAKDAASGADATTPGPSDTASAEPEVQKFTQRLQADGSEVDEGAASATDAAAGEGRSLAPQTVASSDVDTAPKPAPGNPAPGKPAVIPVGVSQKMFLYEERVGQTSPVAVEGAVVWTLKHEKADNGKDEAIVQAQVTAPDRGLSALISFKRNLDPSLPASHLVELVFSLPKTFEGGAIESVQRIALKQTEQDRGDPLIAVPAKITDDFHMIALNDYADARDFNLRLLQTRNWIDIPVTYRNGRRALITMEKGSTGTEVFSQAIREWRAADPSSSAVPDTPPAQPTSGNP